MEDDEKKGGLSPIAKAGLTVAALIVAKKVYDSFFRRYERPDYKITPGLFNYNFYASILPREMITFPSKNATLQGYFYQCNKSDKLIVLSHGFHAGADDFLPMISYLVKNGFNVFAYDVRGTFSSSGSSTVGFCRWLVDIDYALKFVQGNRRFKHYSIYLLGHSCGGYAVASVLNIRKGIKACASISAPNSGFTLLIEKGSQYAGEFASQGVPKQFLDEVQKRQFGKYTEYTSAGGVNASKTPVFIAHGLEDEVIDFDLQSLVSHKKEFTNPNIKYYYGKHNQAGHTSILFSERSNDYQKEVNKKFKELEKEYKKEKDILYEKKKEYNATIDHYLYSEINYSLFDEIIKFFNEA